MGRIAGLQGEQDGTERCFAVAIRPGDKGVLGKLRITGRSRVAEPADALNRNDLLEHLFPPAPQYRHARPANAGRVSPTKPSVDLPPHPR